MSEHYANDVETTITVASAIATTGTVASASSLPSAPFRAVIQDSSTSSTNREYVTVTGVSGTTLTISRAVEDATRYPAATHSAGSYFAPIVTTMGLYDLLYVDVRAYGATGDGVTDDTTSINAAITACNTAGGGTVFFPAGTYLALALVLKSNVRLLGDGGAILRKNAGTGTQAVIEAVGTVGTGVNTSADVAVGAATITAATNPATLVAGDYVLIRDNTYKYASGPEARNQELTRLITVSGSGPYTFTLATPTIGSYATASTAQILKLTPVYDATVESLTVSVPTGTDGGPIMCTYATGFTVRDCLITGMSNWAGVQANSSSRVRIIANDIRDAQMADVNHGFGLAVDNCHHVHVAGNHFENYMENLFSNNSRDGYFVNNICVGPHDSGVNTHGSGNERLLIADNVITGSLQYGVAVGHTISPATDRDIVVARNLIVDCAASAIVVSAGSGPIPMKYISVKDNILVAWNRSNVASDYGILVSGANENLAIQGNVLDGSGIAQSQEGIVLASCVDVFVSQNTIRNLANGYGIQVDSTTRVTVQGNQLSNISSYNIRSTTANTNLTIRDNVMDDTTIQRSIVNDYWYDNQYGSAVRDGFPAGAFAPGSFTVATGNYVNVIDQLTLATTEQGTVEGTGILRID